MGTVSPGRSGRVHRAWNATARAHAPPPVGTLAMLAQDLEQAYRDATSTTSRRAPPARLPRRRVRTSGFRPARFGRRTAGIVTESGTLTLREAAYEEPIQEETRRWRH